MRAGAEVEVDAGSVHPWNWLPVADCYYRYAGSLSAPDCTEAVTWSVFAAPVSVSARQVQCFSLYDVLVLVLTLHSYSDNNLVLFSSIFNVLSRWFSELAFETRTSICLCAKMSRLRDLKYAVAAGGGGAMVNNVRPLQMLAGRKVFRSFNDTISSCAGLVGSGSGPGKRSGSNPSGGEATVGSAVASSPSPLSVVFSLFGVTLYALAPHM